MDIAKKIKEKIDKHYVGGHLSYSDLIEHLKSNRIDRGENLEDKHGGFDTENGGSLAVFYYADSSILILNGYSVATAKKT